MEGNSCGKGHVGNSRLRFTKEQAESEAVKHPAVNNHGLLTERYRLQSRYGLEVGKNSKQEVENEHSSREW